VTPPDDLRNKRLLFRSWHRGSRESDLILGRFAETYLDLFDDAQLDRYEALLACNDAEIFDWVTGRAAPPPAHDHDVMRLLLAFCSLPLSIPYGIATSPPSAEEGGTGERSSPAAGSEYQPLPPILFLDGEEGKELDGER
jgi:antitoxin CptB